MVVGALVGAALPVCADVSDAFRADVEGLTAGAHRLTGTAEGQAAFEYVSRRVGEMAPDQVITQAFPAVQMRVKRCEVQVAGGRTLPLLPMRPNGIIPPVTPPAGLSGPIVHAGDGAPEEFLDRSVEGAIVVLDYNTGDHWLRAFRLGARAVIFVAAGDAEAWHAHFVEANVNMPRFYYAGLRGGMGMGRGEMR